jgi:hypothetical protein
MRDRRLRQALLALLVSLLAAPVTTRADEPKDPVEATWRARADLAKRRLAQGGLDACDAAVEKGFQGVKETKKDARIFELSIDVGGQVLVVFYRYQGNALDGFAMVSVPPQWLAYQKANSKTLRFLLGPPQNCAFSLCTRGPTDDGPCAEKSP